MVRGRRVARLAGRVGTTAADGLRRDGTDLSLFALGFSPRNGALASGGVDRRLTLRDTDTFKPVGQLSLPAPALVAALAWPPDGRFIAMGDIDDETLSKGGIQLVDAETRTVVAS